MARLRLTETPSGRTKGIVRPSDGGGALELRRRYLDYQSIDQVLGYIRRFAHEGQADPQIRALSERIMGPLVNTDQKIQALYRWIRETISYRLDLRNVEDIQSASATYHLKGGDCEDHVILVAALLSIQGIGTRDVVIRQKGRSDWNHIYLEYNDGGKWILWDTGRPDPVRPGSPAPLDVVQQRKRVLFDPQTRNTLSGISGDDTPVIHVPGNIRLSVIGIDGGNSRTGTPAEVTLELETWRLVYRNLSIDCRHPTIVVRSVKTGIILGTIIPPGGLIDNCVKTLRIQLIGYEAGESIVFEAYEEPAIVLGGPSLRDILNGRGGKPIAKSQPWTLSRVPIVSPTSSGAGLTDIANTLKWAAILGGGAVGAYALFPLIQVARRAIT